MLIVEDGTGLADADSYVSVADCQAYAIAHGLTFEGEPTALEVALRNATIYLDTAYTFRGVRKTREQALEWPRRGIEADGVPRDVLKACCELGVRALIGPLWQDIESTAEGAIASETIGPISTTYAVAKGVRADGQTQFAVVTALLRRWTGSSSMIKLVRS